MKTFGLIGKNIDYSFSRNYFRNKFNKESINNCQYLNFDIDTIDDLKDLFNRNIQGFNVTIPYKQEIIPLLNQLHHDAKIIGAVNTIKTTNNQLVGYNTDWIGFFKSIQPLLKKHHQKALILGTGGASKAIQYAFDKLKIEYKTVSRSKADFMYQDLNQDIIKEHQIIVNCTPKGTFPMINEAPEIPYHHINSQHLAYDLIYNPTETKFLQLCKKQGATIKNGLEMLEIQAEEAWLIWNS